MVRKTIIYGLKMTKRQEAELEFAELKMLRFSLGVTRIDDYIRRIVKVVCLGGYE